MYCENCGKKNSDEAKFCINCGTKLEKKDIFGFDKDEFKIDQSDYEELNDFYSKEDKKKKEESKIEEKEEYKDYGRENSCNNNMNNNLNNNKLNYGNISSGARVNANPFGKNKHMIDLSYEGKSILPAFAVVFVFACMLVGIGTIFFTTADDGFGTVPFVLVMSFFMIILFFMIYGVLETRKSNDAAKEALTKGFNGEAKVVRTYQSANKSSTIKNYIVFTYAINGTVHMSTQSVSAPIYLKYKTGDKIEIKISDKIGVIDEKMMI